MRILRRKTLGACLTLLGALATPTLSWAQAIASDFTYGVRYDDAGRELGTIAPDPDGAGSNTFLAVRNTYDDSGRLIHVETGALTNWQSDAVAPQNWVGFTQFSKVETNYDTFDRKVSETKIVNDVPFALTQYSYDNLGRLECTAVRMNPSAYSSLPSACALGPEGSQGPDRITRNVYDAAGQVLKVQKAYGTALQQDYATFVYTQNGKAATMKDANGNKTAYTYDGFDRQIQWNFPDKVTVGTASTTDYEAYSYDPNGNRVSLRKRDGQTIGYTYDALNRMTVKDIPGGTVGDVYYGYDLRGLQTYARFDNAAGEVASAYDGFGRLISSRTTMGGVSRILSYQYDAGGNRVRITHPDGSFFTSHYDGLDRVDQLYENGTAGIATIGYDAQGRQSGLSLPNIGSAWGYDAVSRLARLEYYYGGSGRDLVQTFAYNPASQVTATTRNDDGFAFTGYTAASNAYTANGLNQYTAVGAGSLGYDANGNLASTGGTTFSYDVENRLVQAAGTLNVSLAYDPLGRLWQTSGPSGTTQFLYDGDALVEEYDGSGVRSQTYVHAPGDDRPLLWYEGSGIGSGNLRSLEADRQGSILSVANASGVLLAINTYDEYGVPDAGNAGRFQYTGQAYIPELGMYYYKARIYASRLGRFLQTDPIGYEDQNNLYAYVANDPVNKTDPTGQQSTEFQLEAQADGSFLQGLTPQERREYISLRFNGQVQGLAMFAATELTGAALIKGAGWTASVALPVARLMRGAEVFKPIASGLKAAFERASAVNTGLGRLAAGEGRIIAGPGAKDAFRGAEAAAAKYGGQGSEYAKVSVSSVTAAGDRVSVHAIRNETTKEIFEQKVIYGR